MFRALNKSGLYLCNSYRNTLHLILMFVLFCNKPSMVQFYLLIFSVVSSLIIMLFVTEEVYIAFLIMAKSKGKITYLSIRSGLQ